MRELPNVLRAMDQPTNDGVNTYFVSQAARQAGLAVVLSGLGGDEVFGGYKHYRWLIRSAPCAVSPGCPLPAPHRPRHGGGLRRPGQGTLDAPLVPGRRRHAAGPVRRCCGLLRARTGPRAARRRFARGPRSPTSILEAPRHRAATGVATGPAFRRMEMGRYMHDQLLRDTDVFSMAHSIEVRVPLSGSRLVDTASALAQATAGDAHAPGNKPLLTAAAGDPAVFDAAAAASAASRSPSANG